MKIVRFGNRGSERAGLIDRRARVRDASAVVPDITARALANGALQQLAPVDPEELPLVPDGVRLGACIGEVGNFIACGLNYEDHARETNTPVPAEPVLFNKAPSCICGPNDDIVLPRGSTKTDWEAELAVVIGREAHYLTVGEANAAVAGYCVCHDVSEREYQIERGGQWTKGKSAPTFGPLGPWLVTPDEIEDVHNLSVWLTVNGHLRQSGSTRLMIFKIPFLVSYVSQFMRLLPGDVITTGTPPGVGLGMKPPQFLRAGDVVRLGIDGLGEQQQRVTGE